jgi:hypothetical protein
MPLRVLILGQQNNQNCARQGNSVTPRGCALPSTVQLLMWIFHEAEISQINQTKISDKAGS